MKKKHDAADRRPDGKRRKAPLRIRLLAAVLSPLAFLLLVELALRLIGYGLPSGFFVPWRHAGETIYLPNQRYCEHFVPKALSRTPQFSVLYPKTPSTVRIFVLGGSAANGDPEPAYGFCRQLKILLNEHSNGTTFEVINAAVTAMNSFVARRIARDCAVHGADLFIVYMGNNEVVGPYGPPTLPPGLYRSRAFINTAITLKKDLRLGQLIKNSAEALRCRGRPQQWAGMEAFLASRTAEGDGRLEDCYRHFQANVRDIVAAAHARGARTLLCTVPTNVVSCAPFGSQHKAGLTQAEMARWDGFFQAGRTLQHKGDFDAALAEYEKARLTDDTYADLAFCMGKCLLDLGKVPEARAMFTRARDLDTLRFRADSRIDQIIRRQAQALAGQGARLLDLEAVLEEKNRGLPLGDSVLVDHVHLNVPANFQIAYAAMQAVREALPDAHLIAPARSPEELFELCRSRMLYDVREQYGVAMVMYGRKVRPPFVGQLDHDAELVSLRTALFQLRGAAKTAGDAEAEYVDAVKKAPHDALLVRRYGDYLLRHQRRAEAVAAYQRYLEDCPFDMDVRTALAEAMATDGARDKAMAVLTARQTPFPSTHEEALQLLGALYVKRGRHAEVLSVYEELCRLAPRDVTAMVNLASAAIYTGDLTRAKETLDQALKIDPCSVPALIGMGNYHVQRGQTQEAHAWFERAVTADPYNYIPQFDLGTQKLKLGQLRDGLRHVTESVTLKPDFVQGYQTLATVYADYGKADAARTYATLRDLFCP
jgi:tetratricopeptide (TPR) repeat protein